MHKVCNFGYLTLDNLPEFFCRRDVMDRVPKIKSVLSVKASMEIIFIIFLHMTHPVMSLEIFGRKTMKDLHH